MIYYKNAIRVTLLKKSLRNIHIFFLFHISLMAYFII